MFGYYPSRGYCKTQQGCNLATRSDAIVPHFPTDIVLFNTSAWLASLTKDHVFEFVFGLMGTHINIDKTRRPWLFQYVGAQIIITLCVESETMVRMIKL